MDQAEIKEIIGKTVEAVVRERVSGAMSPAHLEGLFASAARGHVAELVNKDRNLSGQITSALLAEARQAARAFVESLAPAEIEKTIAVNIRSSFDLPKLISAEIRKAISTDVGHQIAKRMGRFMSAVDALLAKGDGEAS